MKPLEDKPNTEPDIELGEVFMHIHSIGWYGLYSKSKNSQFILTWKEGYQENIKGEYRLIEKGKIIARGEIERPNAGKVANNGTFIFNDWMFGDNLQGTFLAFSKSGQINIYHLFSANFHCNGLSGDGKFAICQLAASDTTDSQTMAFFNLENNIMLWQKKPETGFADSIEIDSENQIIKLILGDNDEFCYSFNGEFLDDFKWYQYRIQNGSGYELLEIVDNKLKAQAGILNKGEGQEILDILQIAVKRFSQQPYYQAIGYRKMGEIYERLGDIEKTILNYEIAIKLNPAVGVKKKLALLKPSSPQAIPTSKLPPYSINEFIPNSIRFLSEEKSIPPGHAPRGIYSHIIHYEDSSLYIKNHYNDSELQTGSSTITYLTNFGDFLKSEDLDHLVYRFARSRNSGCFVALSYNLKLYLYSPEFDRLADSDISKGVDERGEIHCLGISNDGNTILYSKKSTLFQLDNKLNVIKSWQSPKESSEPIILEKAHEFEINDITFEIELEYDVSEMDDWICSIEIPKNIDAIYLGYYSGKFCLLYSFGLIKRIYNCNDAIREIKEIGRYIYLITYEGIDILFDAKFLKRLDLHEYIGPGKFLNANYMEKVIVINNKPHLELFTLDNKRIADIEFRDSIAGVFFHEDKLKVVTPKKIFIFSIEYPNVS